MLTSVFICQLSMIMALAQEAAPTALKSLEERWTIGGRITDRDTGQPLPRARVSAFTNLINRAKGPVAFTTTDESGNYTLTGLPAGRYMVLAEPPSHVSSHLAQAYGFDEPHEQTGAIFNIGSGNWVTANNRRDVDIALTRALVIEGRVISDEGDPIAGTSVTLQRVDAPSLEVPVRTTDDRGIFRHFGLSPGRYRLCVRPPGTTDPASPRSMRRTCYPAVGQWLELGSDSIAGFDIRLLRGKAATISGIASTASRAPLDGGEILFLDEADPRRTTLQVERAPGGRFIIRAVEPGVYRLIASLPADGGPEGAARERISMPVTVDGDIENLAVRTRLPATITGAVQFDGMPPTALGSLRLVAQEGAPLLATGTVRMTSQAAPVRDDLSFQLGGMLEPARLMLVGLPSGWVVKAVIYRGRDITDLPVQFESPSDPHPVTIVVTNRVARLTGRVVGPIDRELAVIVFSTDRERWLARGGHMARAVVKADGTFQVAAIPPGDYLVTVTSAAVMFSVTSLERLAARAQRIALAESDRRDITLYATDTR